MLAIRCHAQFSSSGKALTPKPNQPKADSLRYISECRRPRVEDIVDVFWTRKWIRGVVERVNDTVVGVNYHDGYYEHELEGQSACSVLLLSLCTGLPPVACSPPPSVPTVADRSRRPPPLPSFPVYRVQREPASDKLDAGIIPTMRPTLSHLQRCRRRSTNHVRHVRRNGAFGLLRAPA